MKPTSDLFDLICSLSKTEKRYFKQHSKLHVIGEKNNYLRLFDAISKQKQSRNSENFSSGTYDEAKILKQFHGANFTKQFAAAKHFLYHQILKVLRSYHRSIHSELRDLLHNAEILYDKGHYSQSYKAIKKAKEIAKNNGMHWAMLEIFDVWEYNLAIKKKEGVWIEDILKEKNNELELLQNTNVYRDINSRIHALYLNHGKARNKFDIEKMDGIMKSGAMRNESGPVTFDAKYSFYSSHLFYWDTKNDANAFYKYAKKGIELFHSQPEKIAENSFKYIIQISNLIASCINSKKHEDASKYLKKMKQSAPLIKSRSERVDFFYLYHSLLLSHLYDTARFSTATAAIPSIAEELKKHESKSSELSKTILFANIALAYFGAEKYHQSILWLNRIRNEISQTVRKDIEISIRLLYVIVHYEVRNTDLLPYLIQSLYRFLRHKKNLYKFEMIVIAFLRNEVPKSNTNKKIIEAFQKLKNELVPLTKDPYERTAFAFFDYISWLDSKIRNRPFAEIIREKIKNS